MSLLLVAFGDGKSSHIGSDKLVALVDGLSLNNLVIICMLHSTETLVISVHKWLNFTVVQYADFERSMPFVRLMYAQYYTTVNGLNGALPTAYDAPSAPKLMMLIDDGPVAVESYRLFGYGPAELEGNLRDWLVGQPKGFLAHQLVHCWSPEISEPNANHNCNSSNDMIAPETLLENVE